MLSILQIQIYSLYMTKGTCSFFANRAPEPTFSFKEWEDELRQFEVVKKRLWILLDFTHLLRLLEQIEMEKEPPPSSYRQVFVDSLKFLRSSKFSGKFLIETECGDDKPITPGYR